MEYRVLLIGSSFDDPWEQTLEAASKALGQLDVMDELEALRVSSQQNYDLIIVDATQIEGFLPLVAQLHHQKPQARVVVVTTSPTWERARDAFQAGATDYIRKSANGEEILAMLPKVGCNAPPQ